MVTIGDFSVILAAKKDAGGYLFRGMLPGDEEISFKGILTAFSTALGLGDFKLPDTIPDIILKCVTVEFAMEKKAFTASAAVIAGEQENGAGGIIGKLFGINAVVTVASEINNGSRTFSGSFKGALFIGAQKLALEYLFGGGTGRQITASWQASGAGGGLALADILKEFGAKQIPPVLADLDAGLTGVKMTYNPEFPCYFPTT
jgi:hypothetical protein